MIRRAFLFIAFALSVLLSGCGETRFEPIHIFEGTKQLLAERPTYWGFSCSFLGEKERQAVREGFEYWDNMARQKLFQEVQDCDSINPSDKGILVTRSIASNARSTKEFTILAYVERYGNSDGMVGAEMVFEPEWGSDAFADETFLGTPRHEVGHVLGFEHFPRKSCLMYKTISAHDDDMPLESGKTKEACTEELSIFHLYYGN